jgi:hypothetical protein
MKKFVVFITIILFAIVLAGLYGIIHDQITYSIAPEYFTRFKYRQFNIDPAIYGDRMAVALIGFLATWWMGYIIGIPLSAVALIYPDHRSMRRSALKAIVIVFITAVIFGVIGYFRGKYHLVKTGVDWWLPEDLIHRDDFIIVGSIHNYSYLGGIVGLILGIIYLVTMRYTSSKKYETA